MKSVEDIFGIPIKNEQIFTQALTHSSYTKENNLDSTKCYERLEFLGDAVLKLTISDVLYKLYPNSSEGELSKIRAIVVSDNTLAQITKETGLYKLIIVGKHEKKQKCQELNSVCACAYEAVLGAYYLDGELSKLTKYIKTTFEPYIKDVQQNFEKFNAKAILQEYTQEIHKDRPQYVVVNEKGPQHKKVFEVEVHYRGEVLASGTGLSKKDAEQKAAYTACKSLGVI